MKLSPWDPGYPRSLVPHDSQPSIVTSGPLDDGSRRIAIVGSRTGDSGSQELAHQLAYHLAKAGFVIVSGGAVGVDTAAHKGARKAGGATWVVACTGRGAPAYPEENGSLFAEIERDPRSRMIWPFHDGTPMTRTTPRFRNTILVMLAEHVVVVQAHARSGSLNAASAARYYGRPLWVVPGAPWNKQSEGSLQLLVDGARPVWSVESFFTDLGLPRPDMDDTHATLGLTNVARTRKPRHVRKVSRSVQLPISPGAPRTVDVASLTNEERRVLSCISMGRTQQDEIIAKTGLGTSSAVSALLTLSLKDVVVEGPGGFFRRSHVSLSHQDNSSSLGVNPTEEPVSEGSRSGDG